MNPGKKIIFILIPIVIVFFYFLGTLSSRSLSTKKDKVVTTSSPEVASSEASHHGPPPAADDVTFKSLLDKTAPDFKLVSYDGKEVSLSDLRGKRVVMFFSEGAMCYPSCWDQMVALVKDPKFNNSTTATLSIIVDPKNEWDQAVEKMPELKNAIVLLDTTKSVVASYGVLTLNSSMHRGQFPGHTYLILDKEGIVRYELDDEHMQIRNKELLTQLDKMI